MDTVIIGGKRVGQKLSERLCAQDIAVVFLENDSVIVEQATNVGIDARETDISDVRALSDCRLNRAQTVIVATEDDSRNLLITQLLRVEFEPDRLIVLVNQPQNLDLFDELDVEIVNLTRVLTAAIETAHSSKHAY